MKRILIGIALFITGAIGLVLSFCGAMFMSYSSHHGGGTPDQEYWLAMTVVVVGVLMIVGVVAFVVHRLTRRRTPTVMSGAIRSTDDLPQG